MTGLDVRRMVDEQWPLGQVFCGTLEGYPVRIQMGLKAVEMHVSPVVFFKDVIVFGGVPPLSHRLANAAAAVGEELLHIHGAEMVTEAVLKHDWEQMNKAINAVIKDLGRENVRSRDILAVLPNGYTVPNEEFRWARLSKPRGMLNRYMEIELEQKSGRRRQLKFHVSLANTVEMILYAAFGDRLVAAL